MIEPTVSEFINKLMGLCMKDNGSKTCRMEPGKNSGQISHGIQENTKWELNKDLV